MNKYFVSYNQALSLKELGFDEPCFGLFVRDKSLLIKEMPNQEECELFFGGILAPTFSQAFRFFREKYTLYSIISTIMHTYPNLQFYFKIQGLNNGMIIDKFNSYEEAELACIDKLIELTKKQNLC